MAYYFLFPEKDTTLYGHPDRTEQNTGHDEILEIVKEKGTTNEKYYPSRILIKFKNNEVQDLINNTIGFSTFNTAASCSLQLLSTEHKNLSRILNLETFAVSQSWDEGTGKYPNTPKTSNGCSWKYRDNDVSKNVWITGSSTNVGVTYGSASININQVPSASEHRITINSIDFVPVVSSSLFDSDSTNDIFVNISGSLEQFGSNLASAINASSSLTLITATFTGSTNILTLSGSNSGSQGNVTITTSSVDGNDQNVFSNDAIGSFNTQGGTSTTTSIFANGTSGSIKSDLGVVQGGGTWYTGSDYNATQQFINASKLDTNFNVTSIVKKHYLNIENNSTYPTGINNNGFIIKQPDAIEENLSSSFGEMKYFSTDTHTIYPPRLIFKWDDSSHSKQSSAKQNGELNVSLYRNQKEYNQNDEATFRVHVRDKYPTRQFASSSNFLTPGYFTTSSFYSIRDAYTEEEVIPFDSNFTKISADNEGMYFKIYMNGLQPERYYRLLFKHKNNEGTTIYDNNYHFKVIR